MADPFLLLMMLVWVPVSIAVVWWHNRDFRRRVEGRPYEMLRWSIETDDPVVKAEIPGYMRRSALLAVALVAFFLVTGYLVANV